MKQTAFGSMRDFLVSDRTTAPRAADSSTGIAIGALLVSLVAIAALCPGATHAVGRIPSPGCQGPERRSADLYGAGGLRVHGKLDACHVERAPRPQLHR